jgi:hypothetical protein
LYGFLFKFNEKLCFASCLVLFGPLSHPLC